MSNPNNEPPRKEDEATHLAGLVGLDNDPAVEASTEPGPGHPEDPHTLHRRKFLRRLSYGVGGLGAALAVIPVAGFVVLPLFNQPPEVWRDLGPTAQFKMGQTVEVKFENAAP